jgi:hypothetical protein
VAGLKPVRIPEHVADHIATLPRAAQEELSRLFHELEDQGGEHPSLVAAGLETPLGTLLVALGDTNCYATFLDEPDAYLIVRADVERPARTFPRPM